MQSPVKVNRRVFKTWLDEIQTLLSANFAEPAIATLTAPDKTVAANLLVDIIVTNRARERDPWTSQVIAPTQCHYRVRTNYALLNNIRVYAL